MYFSNIDIPLLLAITTFVVICLVATGVMTYISYLSHRRELIRKIATEENEWEETEKAVPSLEAQENPNNPLVKLLHAIGMKTKPKRTSDHSRLKFKFQRAGL